MIPCSCCSLMIWSYSAAKQGVQVSCSDNLGGEDFLAYWKAKGGGFLSMAGLFRIILPQLLPVVL